MFGIHDFWLFLISGVLLNLTPGQDTFYILGRSIAGGRSVGLLSVLGIATGSIVHTLAAALGLSTLLAASTMAFSIVKIAGAAYLIYLGAKLLLSKSTAISETMASDSESYWFAYRQGVLSNILNPKVALFFIAFLPQFIAADSAHEVTAFLLLGGTFVVTGTLWCSMLALGAARFRRFFASNPSARLAIDRCVGGVFVALGVRLAIAR